MTKREMMVKAHKMAKMMVGNYAARLSLALKELWAIAKKGVVKVVEMVNLTGSEKQIAWATDIRKAIVAKFEKAETTIDYEITKDEEAEVIETFYSTVNKIASAKKWIEIKDQFFGFDKVDICETLISIEEAM